MILQSLCEWCKTEIPQQGIVTEGIRPAGTIQKGNTQKRPEKNKKNFLHARMNKININFIPFSAEAFIVGGTVRDLLLGIAPTDIDIVTFRDPETLSRHIAAKTRGNMVALGKPGQSIFRIITKSHTYDVAAAAGPSIEEDLAQRDFTVNAMAAGLFLDPNQAPVIDPYNGTKDLENRIIRMVAAVNLRSDPLRLLRAFRLAAILNFSIDPDTGRAIRAAAPLIHKSAGERVREELMKLFATAHSADLLRAMDKSGLLTEIFPELLPLKDCTQNVYHQYDAFEHTLKAYEFMERLLHAPDGLIPEVPNLKKLLPPAKRFSLLKYAILIHDIGKPAARTIDSDGRIHFYTHETKSADMADAISRRLRLSNHSRQCVDFIIRHHLRPLSLFNAFRQHRLTKKAISRFFLKCHPLTEEILIHSTADLYGKGIRKNIREFTRFLNHIIDEYTDSFTPKKTLPPLLTGRDLIREFDLAPSPLFSRILTHLEEERFAETITTRADALIWVKNFLKSA